MPRPHLLPLMLALLPGLAAAGQVCPPADLSAPLPGVDEITLARADVSTAGYPGQWQEGVYGSEGYAYRLFSDGTGTVADDLRLRGWHVDFTCDLAQKSCRFEAGLSAPAAAVAAAKAIGDCLTASPPQPRRRPESLRAGPPAVPPLPSSFPPVAPPLPPAPAAGAAAARKAAVVAPEMPVAKTPAKAAPAASVPFAAGKEAAAVTKPAVKADTKPDAPPPAAKAGTGPGGKTGDKAAARTADKPAPKTAGDAEPTPKAKPPAAPVPAAAPASAAACWADHLPDEPAAQKMQRLLLLAGYDPGPIDGQAGGRTRAALRAALGPAADPLTPETAILALRARICPAAPDAAPASAAFDASDSRKASCP